MDAVRSIEEAAGYGKIYWWYREKDTLLLRHFSVSRSLVLSLKVHARELARSSG